MNRDNAGRSLTEIYLERLHDFNSLKSRRMKQIEAIPSSIKTILNAYFRKDKNALGQIQEARAIMYWEHCVGQEVARISKVLRIRNFTLVIEVASPLWAQQLILLKQEILNKYRREFPSLKLKDIFFSLNS